MQIKFLLLPVVLATIFTTSTCVADDLIVRIGHVAPLTGPNAHLGKDNENGAKMAIEELNAEDIMIGGVRAKFELVAEDDASDVKRATSVAEKLVNARVNGVVGHLNSSASIATSKIYHGAKIPQISPSSTAAAYTASNSDSTFRVVASDVQIGAVLGRYAVQTLKANMIAVVDDGSTYGEGIANEFIKGAQNEARAKNMRVNFVRSQIVNTSASGIKSGLSKIKEERPQVVFFGGMDTIAGPILNQMRALGIKAKFMGGDGICTTALAKLASGAMTDGQVTCAEAGGVVDTQKVAYDNFRAAYRKKFGADIVIYAPYAYDAVMTLADAMQQAKSADPEVYLPYLQRILHKGITGDIAFDYKGNLKEGTMTMFTYKGGKRLPIGILTSSPL